MRDKRRQMTIEEWVAEDPEKRRAWNQNGVVHATVSVTPQQEAGEAPIQPEQGKMEQDPKLALDRPQG